MCTPSLARLWTLRSMWALPPSRRNASRCSCSGAIRCSSLARVPVELNVCVGCCVHWPRAYKPSTNSQVSACPLHILPRSAVRQQQSQQTGHRPITMSASQDAILARSSPRRSKRTKTHVRSALIQSFAGSHSSPLTIHDDKDDSIDGTEDENEADPGVSRPSHARRIKHQDDRDDDYYDDSQLSRPRPTSQRNQVHDQASARASGCDLKAGDPVQCPICSHKLTLAALNHHLDRACCYPGYPEPSAEERVLRQSLQEPLHLGSSRRLRSRRALMELRA